MESSNQSQFVQFLQKAKRSRGDRGDKLLGGICGGFAAHCVNNASQRYAYQPNPDGHVHRASLRKDGRYRTTNRERVIPGRHQFHDYNF